MDEHLIAISKAYDQTVEDYHAERDWLEQVPLEFRQSEKFKQFLEVCQEGTSTSVAPATKEFLSPEPGLKFLDAGCCANLYNYRLDQWGTSYYGIDISNSLIDAMRNFASKQNIVVGALEVAEVAHIPFPDDFFDIATCIGVLEYFSLSYCREALKELSRVLKPNGRLVVDIPNYDNQLTQTMLDLEKYLGRPTIAKDRLEFETLMKESFLIARCDDTSIMINYFLKRLPLSL